MWNKDLQFSSQTNPFNCINFFSKISVVGNGCKWRMMGNNQIVQTASYLEVDPIGIKMIARGLTCNRHTVVYVITDNTKLTIAY